MRYLHAEERNYDQRMRIWAIIGSVIVGIFSFFVTWLRYRTPQIADLSDFLDRLEEIGSAQEDIKSQIAKQNENLGIQQVNASQVLEKLTKVESIQERILSALKKLGVAPQNAVIGNNTEESSKQSDEEGATGYFGWKSVIGTVATIAVIAFCLI
ncbi:unnamed protein product [Hymenolepis diminuta]|nr:unnamed protein product [Hymenolepis diminuta]